MKNQLNIEMFAKQLAHAIPVSQHRQMLAHWAICIKGSELRMNNIYAHEILGTKPPDIDPGEWGWEKAQDKRLEEKALFLRVLAASFARATNNDWRAPEEL